MRYIVARKYNVHGNCDYLCEWDVIWGPSWSGRPIAMEFTDFTRAMDAAETAKACMRRVEWITPGYGNHAVVEVREVAA